MSGNVWPQELTLIWLYICSNSIRGCASIFSKRTVRREVEPPPAGAGGSPQQRDLPPAHGGYDCASGSAGRNWLLATPRFSRSRGSAFHPQLDLGDAKARDCLPPPGRPCNTRHFTHALPCQTVSRSISKPDPDQDPGQQQRTRPLSNGEAWPEDVPKSRAILNSDEVSPLLSRAS